jgi:hypothetical protein
MGCLLRFRCGAQTPAAPRLADASRDIEYHADRHRAGETVTPDGLQARERNAPAFRANGIATELTRADLSLEVG